MNKKNFLVYLGLVTQSIYIYAPEEGMLHIHDSRPVVDQSELLVADKIKLFEAQKAGRAVLKKSSASDVYGSSRLAGPVSASRREDSISMYTDNPMRGKSLSSSQNSETASAKSISNTSIDRVNSKTTSARSISNASIDRVNPMIKKSFLDQPAGELVVESEPKSVGFSGEDIFPDSTQADIAQWRKTSSDFYRSSALDMSSKVVKPSSADDGTLFSHSLEQLNYRANPDFIYTGIRRISSVGDIGNLVKDMDAVMNSDLLTKNPELYMQILGEVVGVSSISLSSLHARLNNLLNDEGLAGGDTLLDLTIQTLTKLKTSYKTSLRTGKQKARFAPISLDVNPENQSDYNNAKIAFLNKVIELANPLFPKKMRFFQLGK